MYLMTSVAETLASSGSYCGLPVLINQKLHNRCPFYHVLEHDNFITENLPAAVLRDRVKWSTA